MSASILAIVSVMLVSSFVNVLSDATSEGTSVSDVTSVTLHQNSYILDFSRAPTSADDVTTNDLTQSAACTTASSPTLSTKADISSFVNPTDTMTEENNLVQGDTTTTLTQTVFTKPDCNLVESLASASTVTRFVRQLETTDVVTSEYGDDDDVHYIACTAALRGGPDSRAQNAVLAFVENASVAGDCDNVRVELHDSNLDLVDFIPISPSPPFVSSASVLVELPIAALTVSISALSTCGFDITMRYHIMQSAKLLPVVMTSPESGYVTTPGFDVGKTYPKYTNAAFTLNITENEMLLISFPHFVVESAPYCRYDKFTLRYEDENGTVLENSEVCGPKDFRYRLFSSGVFSIRFQSDGYYEMSGFKMLFTLLNKSEAPTPLGGENGTELFDCSGPGFAKYSHQLQCSLAANCLGAEDEANCNYTSPACDHDVDFGDRCLTFSTLKAAQRGEIEGRSWFEAYSECQKQGMDLLTLKTTEDWETFKDLVQQYGKASATYYVGLRTSQCFSADVPELYREMWQWSDEAMAVSTELLDTIMSPISLPKCSSYASTQSSLRLTFCSCTDSDDARFVCERVKRPGHKKALPVQVYKLDVSDTLNHPNISLVECPSGHVVRDFLSCDLQSQCHSEQNGPLCASSSGGPVAMFPCDHTTQYVHYSMVCDFRQDCSDASDETFCRHETCPLDNVRCYNGQCITTAQQCDGVRHCQDNTDENCPLTISRIEPFVPPPVLLKFDGKGGYSLFSHNESCPSTHFRCSSADYCLPIYVLCNGVPDCPNKEDELTCDKYTCPGYYRCRSSKVCLHPQHLCDGAFQCPRHDDELLCDLRCPSGCSCNGLAFKCTSVFSADSYTTLRFLDATGSGMQLRDFSNNRYLIRLHLRRCRIKALQNVLLPNLQVLDVGKNYLTWISLSAFDFFPNLKVLNLTGNSLRQFWDTPFMPHRLLTVLDLSNTGIWSLNSSLLSSALPAIRELNLSSSRLTKVEASGFGGLQEIEVLDLRGCRLEDYPADMLQHLPKLRQVYAEDFKLCCKASLPTHMDPDDCTAPPDLVASCDDLLRSDVYRVCLWVAALLAMLGNVGSFVARARLHTESLHTSFSVLVTNLSLSDFIMGLYLAIIGVADQVYRGRYLWHAESWKNSVTCQTAGFLCLLSLEVSAFFICLITLDRFLLLRFPFSHVHLTLRSAFVASAAAWVAGLCLAAVPLLPMTSHWHLYSQTGICLPLPFNSPGTWSEGQTYSFSVLIVLNLALFLLIAVGQVSIYLAVKSNTMSKAKIKSHISRDAAVARRLTTIVLSDFMCWFPVGLLGILAYSGTSIPAELNVGVAILVLPFNSALNPFLYTFNIVMEKRRKAVEARLLRRLESRHVTEFSRGPPPLAVTLAVTRETALNQIEGWLGLRVITMKEMADRFDMMPRMSYLTEADSLGALPSAGGGMSMTAVL